MRNAEPHRTKNRRNYDARYRIREQQDSYKSIMRVSYGREDIIIQRTKAKGKRTATEDEVEVRGGDARRDVHPVTLLDEGAVGRDSRTSSTALHTRHAHTGHTGDARISRGYTGD